MIFSFMRLNGKTIYAATEAELQSFYSPVLEWLDENTPSHSRHSFDNTLYSDMNEDPLRGYVVKFYNDNDATLFKLRWGGELDL